jgi:hypothetical protein
MVRDFLTGFNHVRSRGGGKFALSPLRRFGNSCATYMKRIFVPLFAIALAASLLGGCVEPQPQLKPKPKPGGFHTPTPTPAVVDNGTSEEPSAPKKGSGAPDESPTKPTNPVPDDGPKQYGNLPYGKAVAGKPGFVTSPYGNPGYIDVRGFPPGTEVKDPYSGKSFLVP